MSNRKSWVIAILLAALVSAASLILAALRFIDMASAISIVTVMLVSTLVMYLRERKSANFMLDERIRRINSRAMGLSWWLTIFGVAALYWLDRLEVLSLSVAQVYGALLVFMPYSFLIITFILRRVGDVRE